jgi:hypothetical protein
MEAKDILIRLLKDGHITDDEFKLLYPKEQTIEPYINPNLIPGIGLHPWEPQIWHGINHPSTGIPIGPTYTIS